MRGNISHKFIRINLCSSMYTFISVINYFSTRVSNEIYAFNLKHTFSFVRFYELIGFIA